MIERLPGPAPTGAPPQGRGRAQGEDEGRDLRAEYGIPAPLRPRGEAAKALTQDAGCTARRWVVEGPPRGMPRVRRGLIRGHTPRRTDLGGLPVACADLTSRQAGLLG
jgi:hypothetical protein